MHRRGPGHVGLVDGNVDVLEDFARGNASGSVRGENEVVAFLSGVFTTDAVNENERRFKLPSFDQEASTIRGPITGHFIHWIFILPGEEDGGC